MSRSHTRLLRITRHHPKLLRDHRRRVSNFNAVMGMRKLWDLSFPGSKNAIFKHKPSLIASCWKGWTPRYSEGEA